MYGFIVQDIATSEYLTQAHITTQKMYMLHKEEHNMYSVLGNNENLVLEKQANFDFVEI